MAKKPAKKATASKKAVATKPKKAAKKAVKTGDALEYFVRTYSSF